MRFQRFELLILTGALALFGCGGSAPEAGAKSNPDPAEVVRENAKVDIHQFYASPSIVPRGESTLLCYGVTDADEVHIDPPVADLWPAYSRCVSVTPKESTTYHLTATGPGGPVTKDLKVEVQGPAGYGVQSLIPLFSASETHVAPGTRVTLCYSVEGADSVTLDPPIMDLPARSHCFTVDVEKTTAFTLRASNEIRNESKQVTVFTE